MGVQATVVFADLTDSTTFFELLGNERATQAVTRVTKWIGDVCEAHGGRVVKMLGDGVLAVFPLAPEAVQAMIEVQRGHHLRLAKWPPGLRMEIKAGIAHGEVVEVDSDCYGDAVNVASRLSNLSGASQVWVTGAVVDAIDDSHGLRFLSLGPIPLRGKAEVQPLYRVEWEEDIVSDFVTQQAVLAQAERDPALTSRLQLNHLEMARSFGPADMPIHLGRAEHAEVIVADPRVSRTHAKIEWRNGSFVLADVSSFGTWVRFAGSDTDVSLRREECPLHGSGEIALGVPLEDLSAPTVAFTVATGATQR